MDDFHQVRTLGPSFRIKLQRPLSHLFLNRKALTNEKLLHFLSPYSNVSDFKRPVEQISYPQQIAVTATGLIWSRYSMVINPVNYNLFAVNVFMAITGLYQLYRKTLQAPPSADLPPGAGLAAAGAAK